MELAFIFLFCFGLLVGVSWCAYKYFDSDAVAQRELDAYLAKILTPSEIGRIYERYIGYLHETDGYKVVYNGALGDFAEINALIIFTVFIFKKIKADCSL